MAYDDLLTLAIEVADEAAVLVREGRRGGVEVAGTKTSPVDIVTEVDHASERLIFDRLTAARPGDAFLGEEGGASAGTGTDRPDQVQWVVDPIDGTVNFVYGIPTYAVSIAAAVGGRAVAGVVLNAHTGERFTATLGGGAFLDDVRLQLPGPDSDVPAKPLSQRLVGTGFNYEAEVKRRQAAAAALMLLEVRDLRRIGSAALDLCAVAAGRYDAYVEEGLNPWDAAAGGLVATEVGAVLSLRRGAGGKDCYVCAPAHEFADFEDLVRRCGFLAPDGAVRPRE